MIDVDKYLIKINSSIRDAVKRIDSGGIGFAVVVDGSQKVLGIITDGDFRRAVLAGIDLNDDVMKVANRNFKFLIKGYSESEAIGLLHVVEYVPVLEDEKLINLLSRNDISGDLSFSGSLMPPIKASVVIMAGGKGTRMQPFTNVLPKPLIPIRGKTMIEIILDEYYKYGIDDFHISVNYKSNMMRAYFEYAEIPYKVSFIDEDKPLGTGGALKFLEGQFDRSFFVSNCDIIIKENYATIMEHHRSSDNLLTMVTSMQHIKIPYGVCEIDKQGNLIGINEKPEFDYLINAGMYLIHPKALKYIPENTFYNITDLIQDLLADDQKVGVFPISEKSYIDVGQWAEYRNAINLLAD